MARKGVRRIREQEVPGAAQRAWRDAVARTRDDRPDDVWVDEGPVEQAVPRSGRQGARGRPAAKDRGRPAAKDKGAGHKPPATGQKPPPPGGRPGRASSGPGMRAKKLPAEVVAEVAGAVPADRAPKVQARLGEAVKAYERDRYLDAVAILRPLADKAPDAAAVRELLGLTYYRLGRWRQAIKELEAFRLLTHSYDQHPTLADCHRALGQYAEVDELYRDLAEASPDAGVVAEGRIVAAGALADRGRLRDAIKLLEQGKLSAKKPRSHHLRLWYALADLYERAGEVPKARSLFERLAEHDPELYDVATRLRTLG